MILEAIVKRHCITATYNRGVVTMAPHILYTRHDELHLDAVALDRDGKPPRELKIGTYRLSGLGAITRIERPFYPVEGFDPAAERYQGTTLLAVDRT
ncbi:MAG: WYL domain-containing protein [Sphingomonas sp.]|nr:WYL domain-containing protein [Sphingomonas sp.]